MIDDDHCHLVQPLASVIGWVGCRWPLLRWRKIIYSVIDSEDVQINSTLSVVFNLAAMFISGETLASQLYFYCSLDLFIPTIIQQWIQQAINSDKY